MPDLELGTVIARREFDLSDGGKVILEVGAPYPVDEGKNWFCPFRIEGVDHVIVQRIGGVDALQALDLGLKITATLLYTSDHYRRKALTWCGQLNLGLPVPNTIADIVPPEDQ